MKKLGTAAHQTTKFFRQNKVRPYDLKEMVARRNVEIIDSLVLLPGDSKEDEIEESLKWNQDEAKQLAQRFHSIVMP